MKGACIVGVTVAVFVLAADSIASSATETDWTALTSGNINDAGNWSAGPPAPDVFAVVPANTPALTIAVDQPVTVASFFLRSSQVTLLLPENTSFTAPSYNYNADATNVENDGTFLLRATTAPDLTTITTVSGAFENLNHGAILLGSGRTLFFDANRFDDNGTLIVNSDGGSTRAVLTLDQPNGPKVLDFAGNGTVRLNAGSDPQLAQLVGIVGGQLWQEESHSIAGSGLITVPITDNWGQIVADRASQHLVIRSSGTPSSVPSGLLGNQGKLSATAGGILDLDGTASQNGVIVSQSYGLPSGTVLADGGTVRLLGGMTIVAGQIASRGSGEIVNAAGMNTIAGTDFEQGHVAVLGGTTLTIKDGLLFGSADDIVVNADSAASQAVLNVLPGSKFLGDAPIRAGGDGTWGKIVVNSAGIVRFSHNPSPATSSVGSLTVNGTGRVDLGNGILEIHYTGNVDPAQEIQRYVMAAYDGGRWDGPGIGSTEADASHAAIGFADSADGVVLALPANTVVVKLARYGDANLDGKVDFSDLIDLARHYGQSNATWDQGDFNYDGTVGVDDLLLLARNYGAPALTGSELAELDPVFRTDVERAFADVPEPSWLNFVWPALAGLTRVRKGPG